MFTKCEIYDNKFNTKLYSSKFVSCLKIVAQAILSSFGNLILSNDIELRDLHEDGSKLKKKKAAKCKNQTCRAGQNPNHHPVQPSHFTDEFISVHLSQRLETAHQDSATSSVIPTDCYSEPLVKR